VRVPFTKAHGALNDFLLTWASAAPRSALADVARRICDRHCGVGADGWYLVALASGASRKYDASLRLFNSDGSEAELSGNGTRCAAAFLLDAGEGGEVTRLATGAGVKELRLLARNGLCFSFEMNMGQPRIEADPVTLSLQRGPLEVTLVDVGNPQCVVFVDDFPAGWRELGAEIESHPRFPNRTNVSFARRLDDHTLEVKFFERGAGETQSSGTGSTGAAAASIARGLVTAPVTVLTPAGPLDLRWDGDVFLAGPAEIVAGGEFYLPS
jgi:diaminopimelate epimerase